MEAPIAGKLNIDTITDIGIAKAYGFCQHLLAWRSGNDKSQDYTYLVSQLDLDIVVLPHIQPITDSTGCTPSVQYSALQREHQAHASSARSWN
ncbi:hypothetical protein V496_03635 [Pseudogymnoascus sp. VKM F-4515 (FW-2607)]|nr:hypothetical protein V496_03635 [Pseudogymnoascus sp. VKM F-4515 (FW-2607)]